MSWELLLLYFRMLMIRVTGRANREVSPMTGTACGCSCLAYRFVSSLPFARRVGDRAETSRQLCGP